MVETTPPGKSYYVSVAPWIQANLHRVLHAFEMYPYIYFEKYLVPVEVDPRITPVHIDNEIVYETYEECFNYCVQNNMNRNKKGCEYFRVLECVKQANFLIDILMRAFNYWMKEVCI